MWTTAALGAIFLSIGLAGLVRRPRWIPQVAAVIAIALAIVAAVVELTS